MNVQDRLGFGWLVPVHGRNMLAQMTPGSVYGGSVAFLLRLDSLRRKLGRLNGQSGVHDMRQADSHARADRHAPQHDLTPGISLATLLAP